MFITLAIYSHEKAYHKNKLSGVLLLIFAKHRGLWDLFRVEAQTLRAQVHCVRFFSTLLFFSFHTFPTTSQARLGFIYTYVTTNLYLN